MDTVLLFLQCCLFPTHLYRINNSSLHNFFSLPNNVISTFCSTENERHLQQSNAVLGFKHTQNAFERESLPHSSRPLAAFEGQGWEGEEREGKWVEENGGEGLYGRRREGRGGKMMGGERRRGEEGEWGKGGERNTIPTLYDLPVPLSCKFARH